MSAHPRERPRPSPSALVQWAVRLKCDLPEARSDGRRQLDARRSSSASDRREHFDEETTLYRNIVLDDLLREREETLGRLRQLGLQTLDLVSEQVTASVLNRYLALRYGEA